MTSKPFHTALSELLEERGISQRELARLTQRHGKGRTETVSNFTVNYLVQGEMAPTVRTMEAIAKALNIGPEHFAEYRMAMARRELDPVQVGFRKALKALDG
jgi:transcriptional regulator with XRE-family HTH domain